MISNMSSSMNTSSYVNSTTTSSNTTEDSDQSVAVCLTFLCAVVIFLVCLRCYIERKLQQEAHSLTSSSHGVVNPENQRPRQRKKDLERSYVVIESSLINMFVVEHDDAMCSHDRPQRIQNSFGHDNRLDGSISDQEERSNDMQAIEYKHETQEADTGDDEETNHHSTILCSICLDPFRVKDIVSVSPKTCSTSSSPSHCHHVFHHSCIKEWLLRHTNCPECREEFFDHHLPNVTKDDTSFEDNGNDKIDNATDSNVPNHHHHHHLFYCIQHGIMIREITATGQYLTSTDPTKLPDVPKQEELMLLRLRKQAKKSILEKQSHDDNNALSVVISISLAEEGSDATVHETDHSDDCVDV